MNTTRHRKLAAIAAAALAVTGGGAAVATAAGGSTSSAAKSALHQQRGPGDLLTAASSYLGVSVSQLQSDLQAGQTLAQVAAATSGKTVDGLIAALVANEQAEHPNASASELTQRVTDFVNGVLPPGGPGHGRGPGGDLSAAASYLGLTDAQLRADFQNGQTLAQIANATSGKSASGLIQALVAVDTARITAFVNGTAPTS